MKKSRLFSLFLTLILVLSLVAPFASAAAESSGSAILDGMTVNAKAAILVLSLIHI